MEEKKTTQLPTPPFVTPGTCPPDMENGDFITFTASNNANKTYFQVTNESDVWFKIVTEDGVVTNNTTFCGESAKALLQYIHQREKAIKQAAGAKIETAKKYPQVKWFDATMSFPPKEVDEQGEVQQASIDVLVYTKDGDVINAWFDYNRAGWYCFGVGKRKGYEEHLTNVTHWCYAPELPKNKEN